MRAKLVMRGLDPRIYPFKRRNGLGAPQRVDARITSAHDEKRDVPQCPG
jgi:hypothetical protein